MCFLCAFVAVVKKSPILGGSFFGTFSGIKSICSTGFSICSSGFYGATIVVSVVTVRPQYACLNKRLFAALITFRPQKFFLFRQTDHHCQMKKSGISALLSSEEFD